MLSVWTTIQMYRRLDGTNDLANEAEPLLLLIEPDELAGKSTPGSSEESGAAMEQRRDERRNRELVERLEQLLQNVPHLGPMIASGSGCRDSAGADGSTMAPSCAGEVLSEKYQLVRQLGNGTFAEVWQSKVLGAADSTVSLKILHGDGAKTKHLVRRFGIGAKILRNRRILTLQKLIEPATESQGFHYLAMEYLAGEICIKRF